MAAATRTPIAKLIGFDLPFVIFVKDGMRDLELDEWVKACREGREPPPALYAPNMGSMGKLIIGSNSPVYVPPLDLAPPYAVLNGGRHVGLQFLKRVNQRKSIITVGEVLGDRTGRSSFSSVMCVVTPLLESDPKDDNELRFWEELAVDAVNHFIEHYRVLAKRPFVQPITPAVIQEFHIGTDYGSGVENWVPTGRGSGHMNGFGGAIADDIDVQIRNAVAQSDPPDFAQVLFAEVQNNADLRNWRMVVIDTAILFEVFLTSLIRFVAAQRGKSDVEIEKLLNQKNGLPHNVEYLAMHVLEEVTGFAFKQDSRFRDWKEKVASLRNDLVHGRKRDVTAEEVEGAFQAANAARDVLRERCLQ